LRLSFCFFAPRKKYYNHYRAPSADCWIVAEVVRYLGNLVAAPALFSSRILAGTFQIRRYRLERSYMTRLKQVLAFIVSWGILLATSPVASDAQEAAQAPLSASQIDQLVSPIALYPDALVAQVLAASTYPDEVTAAATWMQSHSNLSGADLAKQVDQQSWDPSVKALTQFPSVLSNMAQNLSWTSALGDVFYNQQADVMASVQRLRQQAKAAGNLKSTSQQTVTTENQGGQQVIVIQPANPQVVYVPTYNPTVVYGTPYSPPGYSTGAMVATGVISFGVGMAVGAAMSGGCCGWGWNSWGCGWHGGSVTYNRNVYVSNSNVYRGGYGNRYAGSYNYNRSGNRNTNISGNTVNINTGNRSTVNNANRNTNIGSGNPNANINSGNRNNIVNNANRSNAGNRPAQMPAADRGYGQRAQTGTRSSAFGGYSAGGQTRAEASRGRQSLGGGGTQRGGGAARGGGGRRR
jgi:hypothetical protein